MEQTLEYAIQKEGPFVAQLINQKGVPFYKGFRSPYLREKQVRKMKYAGVRCISVMNY